MLSNIFSFLLGIFCSWVALSVGCEYRNYFRGSHKFIRAFYARNWYQKLFTILQRNVDIGRKDIGKLTYVGYIGVVISTIAAFIILLFAIYAYIFNIIEIVSLVFTFWVIFNLGWGLLAAALVFLDSIIGCFR